MRLTRAPGNPRIGDPRIISMATPRYHRCRLDQLIAIDSEFSLALLLQSMEIVQHRLQLDQLG